MNNYIDSTNLSKVAILKDIKALCEEAKIYGFASVCIPPYYVEDASSYLKGSIVKVCTVIGFPNGYSTKETKQFEAINAINNGAEEIDMVININALKNKDYDYVREEISLIREVTKGYILKVIIETCLLTKEEIIKMTEICNETGVDFIKTSTGFDASGAKIEDIDLINKYRNDSLEMKASGGIKNKEEAEEFVKHGVLRLGTSHAKEIVE